MATIADIEGIGPAYAEKLGAAGVSTLADLLAKGGTRAGREELETATGISGTLILKWVNRADLDRVKGVGSEYADLLEAAGVDSVPELAQRNAANLAAKLAEVNDGKNLVRRVPTESEVERWIEDAKTLDRAVHH
jgi:predicted flap endonuclease-1-like 5' DNA nuclease